jgi:hypothetical protein
MLSGPLTLKGSSQPDVRADSAKAGAAAPIGLAERLRSADRFEGLIELLTALRAAPLVASAEGNAIAGCKEAIS